MNRRDFAKYASSIIVLLANGRVLKAQELTERKWQAGKVALRFAIASDGHYGEKDTAYEKFFETIVLRINEEHAKDPFAFCVINGDIVHDNKLHYPAAKTALDKLVPRYYVSQGNHDHLTAAEWKSIWNMEVNLDFSIEQNAFLIATTSDETGAYLCADLDWMAAKLGQYEHHKNVFIFIHINPGQLTKYGIDCPGLFKILDKYKNVRGIFNGHDHDEEGIKMKNNIPFIFDAHFGGSWGTAYRGFRVVELLEDNSIITYIMDPSEKINRAVI